MIALWQRVGYRAVLAINPFPKGIVLRSCARTSLSSIALTQRGVCLA